MTDEELGELVEGLDDHSVIQHYTYAKALMLREIFSQVQALQPEQVFWRHSREEVAESMAELLRTKLDLDEVNEELVTAMVGSAYLVVEVKFE